MASYRAHTCPRCKHYLGVVVHELSAGKKARAVSAVCLRCRYQLDWKLIPGRLLRTWARHPVRQKLQESAYPRAFKPRPARIEQMASADPEPAV